jgi:hypothetical protein
MSEYPPAVLKLAKAISVAEGFGVPGAVPTRANNPGDLTGTDCGSFQTSGKANAEGVWIFTNLADGWEALYLKVNRMLAGKSAIYHLGDTIETLAGKYTGGDNAEAWAANVAAFLGVTVTTTLAELAAAG